jgi:hypothetical protein
MASAWVITQEGTRHSTEVMGILSARKSAKTVKQYVEWLYALLRCYPDQHLEYARYIDPIIPHEAEYKTNTGVPINSIMRCGDNPYLVARLAKNVKLIDEDPDKPILIWTNPERLVCDPNRPHHIMEKLPGSERQAPVRLPLVKRTRVMEDGRAKGKPTSCI